MKPTPERIVLCYHCKAEIAVPAAARTASCPTCYKGIVLDDLAVREGAGMAGRLSTCGKVTIHKKARAVTRHVEAGAGVEVDGVLEAKVNCGGTLVVGAKGRIKGDCNAPSLVVEEGGIIEGGFFRIGHPPEPPPCPVAIPTVSPDPGERAAA